MQLKCLHQAWNWRTCPQLCLYMHMFGIVMLRVIVRRYLHHLRHHRARLSIAFNKYLFNLEKNKVTQIKALSAMNGFFRGTFRTLSNIQDGDFGEKIDG